MDIEKLRSFIEVYNCRNITKAAEVLFVSQSTLGRRIQSLEEELKISLFDRVGTTLQPTDGGKALFKEANNIIRQHDSSIMKINQFKKGVGGSLHIGMMQHLKLSPTVRAISLMQKKYPDVEMTFDCDINTNVPYRLAEKQIDVGITTFGEINGFSGIEYTVLSENTLAMLVGRNHRLWKKRPVYAEDLDGEVLYCYDQSARQSKRQ